MHEYLCMLCSYQLLLLVINISTKRMLKYSIFMNFRTRIHENSKSYAEFLMRYTLFFGSDYTSWTWILHHNILGSYTDFLLVTSVKLPSLLYARIPKPLTYQFCSQSSLNTTTSSQTERSRSSTI